MACSRHDCEAPCQVEMHELHNQSLDSLRMDEHASKLRTATCNAALCKAEGLNATCNKQMARPMAWCVHPGRWRQECFMVIFYPAVYIRMHDGSRFHVSLLHRAGECKQHAVSGSVLLIMPLAFMYATLMTMRFDCRCFRLVRMQLEKVYALCTSHIIQEWCISRVL